MKKMKKLLSLVLTVAMVVAMGVTVFADSSNTYSVSIKEAKPGHTYSAYQIFSGKLEESILSDVSWGAGVNTTTSVEGKTLIQAINEINEFASCTDAKSVAKALENQSSAVVDQFAKVVDKYLATAAGTATDPVNGKYTISGLAAGYYFVKDTANMEGKHDSNTKFIVEVLGSKEVEPKTDVPTVEKKVKETNDTTGIETDWQDAADYDIGDNVPFQLTGTMPSKLDYYSKYSYTFTDTLSTGLTRCEKKDIHVYLVNGNDKTEVTSSFTISDVTTNNQFTVSCSNVKAISGVTKDSKFVVEYTAKLNENAVIGSKGNPNKVDLTFSNNPNGEGKGKTPEDKVIVFTYKIVANKVDEANKSLKGAGFTLYKVDKDGNKTKVGNEIKGEDITSFEFKGTDAGKYVLEETTTPPTYNKAEDLEFEVVATYDTKADEPTLKTLVVKDKNGNQISGKDLTFTVSKNDGSATTTIVNKKGSLLPSTGGIGTTIFYVIGGILMVGAGVILVSRRRRSK